MNPQSFHIHSQFLRQFSTPVVSVQSFHTQTITFTLKRSHEQKGVGTRESSPAHRIDNYKLVFNLYRFTTADYELLQRAAEAPERLLNGVGTRQPRRTKSVL